MNSYLTSRGGPVSPTYVPPPPRKKPVQGQNAPPEQEGQASVFDAPLTYGGMPQEGFSPLKAQQIAGYDGWRAANNVFQDQKGNNVVGVDPRHRGEYLNAQGGYTRPEFFQLLASLKKGNRKPVGEIQQQSTSVFS